MSRFRIQQIAAACMVAFMLTTSVVTVASAAPASAPALQQLQAQEVTGTLPGGEFAKIWLGLKPRNPGDTVTIVSEWNRNNPLINGLGFYVLDETGLRSVLSGAAQARDVNLAAGNVINDAPANQLGATFRATGGDYTIVLYNDSNAEADFTLTATNGIITDDSGQVESTSAATATPAPEEEGTPEPAAPTEAAAAATPTPATPAPAATEAVTVTATPAAVVSTEPGVVRAQEMEGELPNQDDKHFLGLEPSVRDGTLKLTLTIEPQDNPELTRRLNFWVLDEEGFRRYTDPRNKVLLSEVAIAAGSTDDQLPAHVRTASFTSSGFGPYNVIVVNGARQAGEYTLRVDGGLLVDDSGQTKTAQDAAGGTTAAPAATGEAPAAGATAAAAQPAATGREGEPGGTYTVQTGDTLSLIARDIYGDVALYQALCDYNGIQDCNIIEVGDVLRLPTREEIGAGISAPAAQATTAPAVTATPTPQPEVTSAPTVTATATVAAETAITGTTAVTGTAEVTETAPVTETAAVTGTTEAAPTTSNLDIVDTAIAAGSFTKLVAAIDAAGLTDTLKKDGPFTVLAPTDAAFAALDAVAPGALDQLMAQPTGQLTDILLFHVLRNELMSSDITNGMQVTTSQGNPVTFEVDGDSIRVNGANLVEKDIMASNGVIHVIDAVILPY